MEQPGETLTYSSRIAGERIAAELDRLTPWAALQILEWAFNKTLARAVNHGVRDGSDGVQVSDTTPIEWLTGSVHVDWDKCNVTVDGVKITSLRKLQALLLSKVLGFK